MESKATQSNAKQRNAKHFKWRKEHVAWLTIQTDCYALPVSLLRDNFYFFFVFLLKVRSTVFYHHDAINLSQSDTLCSQNCDVWPHCRFGHLYIFIGMFVTWVSVWVPSIIHQSARWVTSFRSWGNFIMYQVANFLCTHAYRLSRKQQHSTATDTRLK